MNKNPITDMWGESDVSAHNDNWYYTKVSFCYREEK